MQIDDHGVWQLGVQEPPPPGPPVPPDIPSLAYWRTALDRWRRDDGQGGTVARLGDVDAAIKALEGASGDGADERHALGSLARQQFEYANEVLRADLLREIPGLGPFHQVFGFTAAEADESLWRAQLIMQGDLRGVWPIPSAEA